ncbi:hypothetical protein [Roseiterribacter gracilis]|uniref:Uncharacterized protein n=1 Tax=Roseiterribacter gracilis TaxID=2812848 RepID=A0A8S8XIH0_9PROT|nr:hypothetical protein TMPK1_32120 [Rhodospirillales bacterium TMPK1]
MAGSFRAEAKIQQIAEAYALDVVDFARAQFDVELDFSDASVQQIEKILGQMYEDARRVRPPQKAIDDYGKAFGFYVGEIFRRNHGAAWGITTMNGEEYTGMQGKGGNLFWPGGKTQKRLTNGPEDNVWHYFQIMIQPQQ